MGWGGLVGAQRQEPGAAGSCGGGTGHRGPLLAGRVLAQHKGTINRAPPGGRGQHAAAGARRSVGKGDSNF